jgi:hypothetical protein
MRDVTKQFYGGFSTEHRIIYIYISIYIYVIICNILNCIHIIIYINMYSYVMLYIYIHICSYTFIQLYIYVLFFHGNVNVPGEFSSLDMEVDIVEIAHQLMPFG